MFPAAGRNSGDMGDRICHGAGQKGFPPDALESEFSHAAKAGVDLPVDKGRAFGGGAGPAVRSFA